MDATITEISEFLPRARRQSSLGPAKILAFGHKQRKIREEKMQKQTPEVHAITRFIDEELAQMKQPLSGKPLLTPQERATLHAAIKPLIALVPFVEEKTIASVRQEYDPEKQPRKYPTDTSVDEEEYWEEMLARGAAPIPGYCLEDSLRPLKLPAGKCQLHVIPLRADIKSFVPFSVQPYRPSLWGAKIMFFILLRMFRLQYQKNRSRVLNQANALNQAKTR